MYFFAWLLLVAALSSCTEAHWKSWLQWGTSTKHTGYTHHASRPDHHYDDYDGAYDGEYGYGGDSSYGDSGVLLDYDSISPVRVGSTFGCSCLLYVEYTQVFQRSQNVEWFSCDRRGLDKCSRYCRNLFRDEGLRASSRQDACDVLGRSVNTPWYRKDQVCGSNGLSRDLSMPVDLCCRRGRPANLCT